jgi:alkanesulfonate monooxygenase SsuD/methylene tetrahydromethanopterin reductase-like flavin-dependent oxidoreductase (luciferase family)
MFPGRVRTAVGLGVPPIIAQMGLRPRSQLAAVRESVAMLRALLGGATCDVAGGEFEAHAVELTHPPNAVPPIYTGVLGPKMLRLSGEVADGTVVSAMASPAYVRWVKERVSEGVRNRADGDAVSHRLPTFAMYCLDADEQAARAAVRPLVALYLSYLARSPLVTVNDFGAEVADMCARGGADAAALIAREMPDAWLDELTVAGDPETCARRIDRLLEAGADSIVLMPVRSGDVESTLRLTAAEVVPRVGSRATADHGASR